MMVTLTFPDDRAVGSLSWHREFAGGEPTMAVGSIEIPEGARVDLQVSFVESVFENENGRVSYSGSDHPVDLRFIADLPRDCIESLHLRSAVEPDSIQFLPHLAPSLRRLHLGRTGMHDDALVHVSQLTGLTYLQTFGNRFTDSGVQVLTSLQLLESLYLEEDTLSVAALRFVHELPRLKRLGLQDMPITADQLAELQANLPGVDVG
jgi:hypothetical protein